jgi:hypothetical protein
MIEQGTALGDDLRFYLINLDRQHTGALHLRIEIIEEFLLVSTICIDIVFVGCRTKLIKACFHRVQLRVNLFDQRIDACIQLLEIATPRGKIVIDDLLAPQDRGDLVELGTGEIQPLLDALACGIGLRPTPRRNGKEKAKNESAKQRGKGKTFDHGLTRDDSGKRGLEAEPF